MVQWACMCNQCYNLIPRVWRPFVIQGKRQHTYACNLSPVAPLQPSATRFPIGFPIATTHGYKQKKTDLAVLVCSPSLQVSKADKPSSLHIVALLQSRVSRRQPYNDSMCFLCSVHPRLCLVAVQSKVCCSAPSFSQLRGGWRQLTSLARESHCVHCDTAGSPNLSRCWTGRKQIGPMEGFDVLARQKH